MHPDLKPLDKAVKKLIQAEIANVWKGAGDPADIPFIERELRDARRSYRRALSGLESTFEAHRSGIPPGVNLE